MPTKVVRKRVAGFTLIELMVVIAVIGILSGIALVSLIGIQQQAKITQSKTDMAQIRRAIVVAQQQSGNSLINITGSACSDCVCRGTDIRNVSTSSSCYINALNALNAIQNVGGYDLKVSILIRDPWGSPYQIDENEREFGPSDCRLDSLSSVGPDGISQTSDDIQSEDIPPSTPCP